MSRRSISTKERARLFTLHGGCCHICEGKIHVGEAWDVSHVIPLALGGDDDDVNRMLAHRKCHRVRTSEQDIPFIARAKRRAANHAGARAPSSRPLPGGRNSKWRKKISGEVVPRHQVDAAIKAYQP
jgi:5-methylcytosine-specific restriction endonuclease McrA